MSSPADKQHIRTLVSRLDRVSRAQATLYLSGGATAVVEGWRTTTDDVWIRFEPEVDELTRAVAHLRESLSLDIQVASPIDSIPELAGWRARSPLVFGTGTLEVHHFDLYSQALLCVARGHDIDLEDMTAMLRRRLIDPDLLRDLYATIAEQLQHHPLIDSGVFQIRFDQALALV